MEAFLVLADSVRNEHGTGKISILGGGWSLIGPGRTHMSLAIFVRASVLESTEPVLFRLHLVEMDGEPVSVEAADGEMRPLFIEGNFRLSDRNELDEDISAVGVHANFAVDVGMIKLPPGRVYRWVLRLNDREAASVAFAIRREKDVVEEADDDLEEL